MHVCNRPHDRDVRIALETVYNQYKSMFTSKYTYKMATKNSTTDARKKAHWCQPFFGQRLGEVSNLHRIAVIKEHN